MVGQIVSALEAGKELSNPAVWKKGQELTNLVGMVIAGVVTAIRYFYPDLLIPDGWTEHIAEFIGTGLVIVNLYLTRATTKKDLTTSAIIEEIK